uniref:TLC domain-containing protein n=1 Tax=Davidia involucrata TaxID=16924 RepID=A0A5B6ZXY0_DAVIN
MEGLHFPLGMMTFTGYARPGKEFHWLLSVIAGIVMCKIVYQLTGVVSLSFFKGYAKLNNLKKLEWNNRGFSTFHALVVAVASFYLLLLSDVFDEGSHDELIINRTSTLSDTILGISVGYFLSDLAMILWHFPALGGIEYVARILLFVFFFYHMFVHFDQVKKVFPLGFYSLLSVPPVLAIMNLFWFWKIAKGMIKTLLKAKHSR